MHAQHLLIYDWRAGTIYSNSNTYDTDTKDKQSIVTLEDESLDEQQPEISRYGVVSRYMVVIQRKSNVLMNTFRVYARPMAYASEFGESVRPFVKRQVVNSLYGVSFLYVFADVSLACYSIRDKGREMRLYTALDQTIWHSMASIAMPALTIHQIVHYSKKYVAPRTTRLFPKYGRFSPIFFGLGAIPFIIHPLDHLADFIMNQTLRKYCYGDKIEVYLH
eukprot:778687_1